LRGVKIDNSLPQRHDNPGKREEMRALAARSAFEYYVDGVVVRTVENTRWHDPLHLVVVSETLPEWFGMPKNDDLPSTFSVEYVRAWKNKAAG
jgi:hypothetical protein